MSLVKLIEAVLNGTISATEALLIEAVLVREYSRFARYQLPAQLRRAASNPPPKDWKWTMKKGKHGHSITMNIDPQGASWSDAEELAVLSKAMPLVATGLKRAFGIDFDFDLVKVFRFELTIVNPTISARIQQAGGPVSDKRRRAAHHEVRSIKVYVEKPEAPSDEDYHPARGNLGAAVNYGPNSAILNNVTSDVVHEYGHLMLPITGKIAKEYFKFIANALEREPSRPNGDQPVPGTTPSVDIVPPKMRKWDYFDGLVDSPKGAMFGTKTARQSFMSLKTEKVEVDFSLTADEFDAIGGDGTWRAIDSAWSNAMQEVRNLIPRMVEMAVNRLFTIFETIISKMLKYGWKSYDILEGIRVHGSIGTATFELMERMRMVAKSQLDDSGKRLSDRFTIEYFNGAGWMPITEHKSQMKKDIANGLSDKIEAFLT